MTDKQVEEKEMMQEKKQDNFNKAILELTKEYIKWKMQLRQAGNPKK